MFVFNSPNAKEQLNNGIFLEDLMTVEAAVETTGYNPQYLRRLLRAGRLEGVKVGQVWLIRIASMEAHIRLGNSSNDRRFGPKTA